MAEESGLENREDGSMPSRGFKSLCLRQKKDTKTVSFFVWGESFPPSPSQAISGVTQFVFSFFLSCLSQTAIPSLRSLQISHPQPNKDQ